MSDLCDFSQSRRSRIGEAVLWAAAGAMMLSFHAGAAIYMMQPVPQMEADDGPPPAIMIELAALPEAVNVDDTTETDDAVDSAEVQSDTVQPVEEIVPPEPIIEDVKQPEPEPLPEPEPIQEVVEPEVLPEPIDEIDPMENQMLAALENVDVPLPVFRPPPPPKEEKKLVEQKKPEPKPEKKRVEQPKPRPPAAKAAETAKANVEQSNRSVAAARGNSSGASAAEVAKYGDRVRSAIARRKPRSLRYDKGVTVSFRVTQSGGITAATLLGSTGDSNADRQILAWISGSKVPAPPAGVDTYFKVPVSPR